MTVPVALAPRRPMGRSQELIWTGQRLRPDLPLANTANVYRIVGSIDPDRFVSAFNSVVEEADALRTVFADIGGVPHPRVLPEPPAPTHVVELLPTELDAWIEERMSTALCMDVCNYDSVLIRHGADDWSWFINIHHVVVDAWATALVFKATADAYEGATLELPEFTDYVQKLEARRDEEAWIRARKHWSDDVASSTPLDALYQTGPETTANQRVPSAFDKQRHQALQRVLSEDLKPLSLELGVLAALATSTAILIHRLTKSGQVSIGVPVHHRRTTEERATIGLLMEIFPLEVAIEDGDTFRSIYTRVMRSLVTLLRWAKPGTSPRTNVDVVLNVITASCGSFGAMPATARWIHSGQVDPVHKLRVQYYDFTGSGHPTLALDINEAVANEQHRDRMPGHLLAVLDAFVSDPDQSVIGVPLVGDEEHHQLVRAYNEQAVVQERARSVADSVIPGLRDMGDGLALIDGPDRFSGAEMASMVSEVALGLRRRGLGRGDRIGIRMERSADAVIAIHGVLQAGSAFVPLDPSYPASRLQHIIDDAELALVLDELPELGHGAASELDQPEPMPAIELDDEAYVLYTSGSTGLPKGVPITHRGLSEYLDFAREAYLDPEEKPVVALISSLSFDLTITSLFLPLLAGGTMVVHRGEGVAALRSVADDERITFLKATPSHLELLVRMIDSGHGLRTAVVGGESFSRALADRLNEVLPDLQVFNEYGPTEAVVGCMVHRFDPAHDIGPEVPIGRPAPGVQLLVLDEAGLVVPEGVAGELYVARSGLAAGYLNRPELTAERFVELELLDGHRAYRTGDLVRFRDPETLEFLGRIDHQLKVQGVRLEPAEVEAALLEHPQITGAAVRLWTPGRRDRVDQCPRCGLGSDVPGVDFDDDGVCSVCRDFDAVKDQADQYFGTRNDLVEARDRARSRRRGQYDALHLLSGGKDSTYALYQMVELGFDVFAFTLDNGFISEGAKDNVRRAVEDLGIDHVFATTDAMNEIFRDSLERFSNVCNGCYKTIYTLAVNQAHELGIPMIVTGLSRGQFFETRLTPGQFARDRFDPTAIDQAVLEARKVYHRTNDASARLLDVSLFDDDAIFDEIEFVDFYRYTDVELDDMYVFLDERAPWIRPDDTGRSTNCLINAAGIYVHEVERGFHNYALPYSWDVRVGHKTRDEAVEELDDELDLEEVRSMLEEIGYEPRRREILTAWYTTDDPNTVEIDPDELRAHVAERVPSHAVPSAMVRIEAMPLSANGKLNDNALPAPDRRHREASTGYVPPDGAVEETLCDIWASVLGLDRVGATDDFFDIGGASLAAVEMIVAVSETYQVTIPEGQAFVFRTVRALADEVESLVLAEIEAMDETTAALALEGP